MKNNILKVEPRGDHEIVMTRTFDAPRALVFEAWTRPELLRRWFGVFGDWSMVLCEVDLRVGGGYHFVWQGPDGEGMGLNGVYREIVQEERIVSTEAFDEPWYPGEAISTLLLVEENGRTLLTNLVSCDSKEIRDEILKSGMETGVAAGYDNLDEVLASLRETA